MASVGQNGRFSSLGGIADKAFTAAFFFLPISKPLLFTSLAVAIVCFIASGGLKDAMTQWRASSWTLPALVLALLPLLSMVIHPNLETRFDDRHLAYYWVFAFITFLAASRTSILKWLKAFLCGVFVVFCYAQAARFGLTDSIHAPGSLRNYIMYSQLLAISVALLAVLYAHESDRWRKTVYLAGMAAFLFGLAAGDGRSGLLAVLVLFPYIFGNIFKQASRGRILLVCAIAVIALLLSPKVQTRIEAAVNDVRLMQSEKKDTSLGYRMDMWKTAVEIFREHPIAGASATGFREVWHSTPRTGEAVGFVEPHNAFLFYASSYGLIGLIPLVWLYVAILRNGWKRRDSLAGGVVFTFGVVLVVGSFTNTMFMGAISHAWVMMFIGLQGHLLKTDWKTA